MSPSDDGRPTLDGRSASAYLWDVDVKGDVTVDVESGLSVQVANAEEGQESSGSHRKLRKCNPALVVLNLVLAGALVATIFVMRDYGSDHHGALPGALDRVEVPENAESQLIVEGKESGESASFDEAWSGEEFQGGESQLIVPENADQDSASFDEEAWTDEEQFLQSESIEAEEESSGSFDDRDSQFDEFTTWAPGEVSRKAHGSAGFDVADGDSRPPQWYIRWREEFQKGD
ncbi:hypothetical protein ACHAXT_001976 [Thalassiosira profunda]